MYAEPHALFRYITLLTLGAPQMSILTSSPGDSEAHSRVRIITLRRRLPPSITDQDFCHYYRFHDYMACFLPEIQGHHLFLDPNCMPNIVKETERDRETALQAFNVGDPGIGKVN